VVGFRVRPRVGVVVRLETHLSRSASAQVTARKPVWERPRKPCGGYGCGGRTRRGTMRRPPAGRHPRGPGCPASGTASPDGRRPGHAGVAAGSRRPAVGRRPDRPAPVRRGRTGRCGRAWPHGHTPAAGPGHASMEPSPLPVRYPVPDPARDPSGDGPGRPGRHLGPENRVAVGPAAGSTVGAAAGTALLLFPTARRNRRSERVREGRSRPGGNPGGGTPRGRGDGADRPCGQVGAGRRVDHRPGPRTVRPVRSPPCVGAESGADDVPGHRGGLR
jgi:hypothetical protein